MKLVITIDLDNAAFSNDGIAEIERLFASIASRLPEPLRPTDGAYSLHDANGNYCGSAEIKGEHDDNDD